MGFQKSHPSRQACLSRPAPFQYLKDLKLTSDCPSSLDSKFLVALVAAAEGLHPDINSSCVKKEQAIVSTKTPAKRTELIPSDLSCD